MNLQIMALADLNRPDDAFPVLRYSIEHENPSPDKKVTVCQDVVSTASEHCFITSFYNI